MFSPALDVVLSMQSPKLGLFCNLDHDWQCWLRSCNFEFRLGIPILWGLLLFLKIVNIHWFLRFILHASYKIDPLAINEIIWEGLTQEKTFNGVLHPTCGQHFKTKFLETVWWVQKSKGYIGKCIYIKFVFLITLVYYANTQLPYITLHDAMRKEKFK